MVLATVGRNAAVEAVTDLLDSGDIRFETSGNSEVATCTFGATAFGAPATGVCTANSIADDTSATGGVVDHAVLRKSDTTPVATATCGTSATDFVLTSLTIGAGDTVSVTSLTMTMPAS